MSFSEQIVEGDTTKKRVCSGEKIFDLTRRSKAVH